MTGVADLGGDKMLDRFGSGIDDPIAMVAGEEKSDHKDQRQEGYRVLFHARPRKP
jgi:hypothetical protein